MKISLETFRILFFTMFITFILNMVNQFLHIKTNAGLPTMTAFTISSIIGICFVAVILCNIDRKKGVLVLFWKKENTTLFIKVSEHKGTSAHDDNGNHYRIGKSWIPKKIDTPS